MKVKIIFAIFISILMLISISQIFSVPPYAGDLFPVYKSGYFKELDNGFSIVRDSFIAIKSMSRPEYAWIFLSDTAVAHDMKIKVYDSQGYLVPAPGEKNDRPDREILKVMHEKNPKAYTEVRGPLYFSIQPLTARGECKFCHTRLNKREVIGAISFERGYDSEIYYSSERIIIFVVITMVLGGLLYALLRWDPGKNIKELFDK